MAHQPPTLGHFDRLSDLFLDIKLGNAGLRQDGFVFLGGLPGSIDLRSSRALYAFPRTHIVRAAQERCCNREIGSFKLVKSVYWARLGLLPVFCTDAYHIAHFLLATVPAEEYDRFNEHHDLPGVVS
jgi:hypothetical protein